ncbi:MAG: hypothetical protein ACI92N_002969 [Pseudomonadales bacterium]|jgi:hypothetical protein
MEPGERMLDNIDKPWSWVKFGWAVFLLIFPNVVLSLLAYVYGLERPWLNVDYALVMLIAVLGFRFLAGAVLSVVFFFDVLGLVGQVVPILRLTDVFYISSFIGMAPLSYQLVAVSLFLLLMFFMFIFLHKKNKLMKVEFLFCINLVVAGYLYSVFYSDVVARQVWSSNDRGLIASQTVFGFNSRKTGFVDTLFAEGEIFGKVPVVGATGSWFDNVSGADERILLVVSESWGVSDENIQSAVLEPLFEAQNHLSDFEDGVVDFRGVTVEAEIRELCQLDLLHFNFQGHKSEMSGCLPNKLVQQGYKTFAFHGAAGLMYDRVRWYPDLGFQESTFFETQSWPRRCYSFPGACDSDMADYVRESFNVEGKVFSYWLTLNSHFSYDTRDIREEGLSCETLGIPGDSQTCRNLSLHFQFFQDLAKLIGNPEMAGVRVVIVGDHEPPISDKDEKLRYFQKGKVPWLSFKILGKTQKYENMNAYLQ